MIEQHDEARDCPLPEFDDIKDKEKFECSCGRTWAYVAGLDLWLFVRAVPTEEKASGNF